MPLTYPEMKQAIQSLLVSNSIGQVLTALQDCVGDEICKLNELNEIAETDAKYRDECIELYRKLTQILTES